MSVAVRLHQVVDVQRRLPKELVAALLAERHQPALDRAHARRRNVAVFGLQSLGLIANVLQHRLQVFQVEQQQSDGRLQS